MNTLNKFFTGVVSLGSLLLGGTGLASEYTTAWGPEIGSTPPLLEAPDQTGTVRSLADLAGEQGLLLFLNRSADW